MCYCYHYQLLSTYRSNHLWTASSDKFHCMMHIYICIDLHRFGYTSKYLMYIQSMYTILRDCPINIISFYAILLRRSQLQSHRKQ